MGSGLKSKKKNKWMPQYMATEEQIKHRDYCIKMYLLIYMIKIQYG